VTKKTNAVLALSSKGNYYGSTNIIKTGPCIILETMDREVSSVLRADNMASSTQQEPVEWGSTSRRPNAL